MKSSVRLFAGFAACCTLLACQKAAPAFAPTGLDEDVDAAAGSQSDSGAGNEPDDKGTTTGGVGFPLDAYGSPTRPPVFASGSAFSCGVKKAGNVMCWSLPVGGTFEFPDPQDYTTIACGGLGCAAVHADGKVFTRGSIVVGMSVEVFSYDDVIKGKKLVRLGTNTNHLGCGVTATGELHCWKVDLPEDSNFTVTLDLKYNARVDEKLSQVEPCEGQEIDCIFGIDAQTGGLHYYEFVEGTQSWQLKQSSAPKIGKFRWLVKGSQAVPAAAGTNWTFGVISEDGSYFDWDYTANTLRHRSTFDGPLIMAVSEGGGFRTCGILEDDGSLICDGQVGNGPLPVHKHFLFLSDDGERTYGMSFDHKFYYWGMLGGTAMVPPAPGTFP